MNENGLLAGSPRASDGSWERMSWETGQECKERAREGEIVLTDEGRCYKSETVSSKGAYSASVEQVACCPLLEFAS